MNYVRTSASERSRGKGLLPVGTRKEKGVALIVSLVLIVLLTLLAVTSLRTSIVEEQVSGNQKLAATSLFAAEQGVSEAMDGIFDGTISDAGNEDDINWTTGWLQGTGTGYRFDYQVRHLLTGGVTVEDDDGRSYLVIDSTGATTNGDGRRLLEIAVAMEMGEGANVAGLIGCQGVTAKSNVVTSSYSSSGQDTTGDRGDIATTDADAFMYLVGSSDFEVYGEVRATGALFLDSNAVVSRDALANLRIEVASGDIYGSAWTNGPYEGDESAVEGDIYQGPSVTPNPLVPLEPCDPWDINDIFAEADDIKGANNNGDIGIASGGNYSGNPATLGVSGAAKDFYFTNFMLEGIQTVTIEGDVRIYVYNDFTMKSNPELILGAGATLKIYVETGNAWIDSVAMVNHDPDDYFPDCDPGGCPINVYLFSKRENTPKDEKYSPPNGTEPDIWDDSETVAAVRIDSNSVFYGIIYAPLGHVALYSNAEVYGSARGRYVTTDSNLEFHYDEDLDKIWVALPTGYKIVYWTELYPDN
jgi:hypothetical protein